MKRVFVLLTLSLFTQISRAQFPQPDGGDLEHGTMPSHWITGGPKCMEVPEWQVHEYNANLYILRQSGCTDAEMPFLYLFFGSERGLLWDTGSRQGDLVPTLRRVVHDWLERNHRASIPLIVTHSHSHDDHTWGDAAVQAMNDPAIPIQFIAPSVEAASKAFGIYPWPTALGQVDLGGRVLNIIPIPGHDTYAIALYDRRTGIALTGDNLYPGRLYVRDFAVYKTSTERLIAFLQDKPVSYVLGNHIEQTRTPFKDFPIG
ncbi:MAG TPA: MBL fold metallo-hydrolase, partial [Candidatus Binataceae bacterium]|nr:MBL fold metallo-hydrolase [Candidatus Binataceae bacterium]